jgi:hypothetical protein
MNWLVWLALGVLAAAIATTLWSLAINWRLERRLAADKKLAAAEALEIITGGDGR